MFGTKVKPKGFIDTFRNISDEYLVVEGWFYCGTVEPVEYKVEGFEFKFIERIYRPDVNEYLGIDGGDFGFKAVFKGRCINGVVPDVLALHDKKLIKKIVNSTDTVLTESKFSSDLLPGYFGLHKSEILEKTETQGYMDENLTTGDYFLLNGWVNDYSDPIVEVIVLDKEGGFSISEFCRYHRPDIVDAFNFNDKGYLAGILLVKKSEITVDLMLVKTSSGDIAVIRANQAIIVDLSRILQSIISQEPTSDKNINKLFKICFDHSAPELLGVVNVAPNKNSKLVIVNCDGASSSDLIRFIVSNENILYSDYDILFSAFDGHLNSIDNGVLRRLSKNFNIGVSFTYTKFEGLVFEYLSKNEIFDDEVVELLFMKVDMFEEANGNIEVLPFDSYQYGSVRGMGTQDDLPMISIGESGIKFDNEGFSLIYGLRLGVGMIDSLNISKHNNFLSLSKSISDSLKKFDCYIDKGFRFAMSNDVLMNEFSIKEMQVMGGDICQ